LGWLTRQLGCSGPPARRILHRLAGLLPAVSPAGEAGVGLPDSELDALCKEFQLADLTPGLGLSGGLVECGWWGSALGDIALSTGARPGGRSVLREAALFHLGFQLFDIVVDNVPAHTRALAGALRPDFLRARLVRPLDDASALHSDDHTASLIVRLFDAAISSAGQRLHADSPHADYIAELLQRMYTSELRTSPDPFDAKRLPVVFVGALAIHPSNGRASELFVHLSQFLSLWDDWADLAEDMLRGAPNAFLSSMHESRPRRALAYAGRSVLRVTSGRAGHGGIVARLREPLDASLALARQLGPDSHDKVVSICRHLMREQP